MTASPGQFDPLAAVEELHAAVRKWTEHIPQNLPYVDLMFAFGFATLGDRPRAESLVEAARKVMVVPIPETPPRWMSEEQARITIGAIMTNFLFKAFKYRVDEALNRKPHAGLLSPELCAEAQEIATRGRSTGLNPHKLAASFIDRFREQSHILEPHARLDPYAAWMRHTDPFRGALVDLHDIYEPGELSDRIRRLLGSAVPRTAPWEVRSRVLHEALLLTPRVGEAFAVELLEQVPAAVNEIVTSMPPERTDLGRIPAQLLTRSFYLAAYYNRCGILRRLTGLLCETIRETKGKEARCRFINATAGECLRSLNKLGMRDDIEQFAEVLRIEAIAPVSLAELRTRYLSEPEAWSSTLQAFLHLATAWRMTGQHDRAAAILAEARESLFNGPDFNAKDYTLLARAYLGALSYGPAETALSRITEFFRLMDRKRITNSWTHAHYFSRFHLNLVEDTVFAVCRMDFAAPHVVSASSP